MSVQEPEIKPGPRGETIETHPAYGQIRVGRVSGAAHLYGSDFTHQHYITVEISRSEVKRNLSTDWLHSGDEIIAIDMSEAQWATFVSSPGVGEGVPCTIRHIERTYLPRLPKPKTRTEQFAAELRAKTNNAISNLDELVEAIGNTSLSMKVKRELVDLVSGAAGQIRAGQEFVAKMFDEHMEKTIERAKVEVNAYTQNLLNRLAVVALPDSSAPVVFDTTAEVPINQLGE
jgi:enamine deaminase RidA (YjgF/YER057c/UK114 family)